MIHKIIKLLKGRQNGQALILALAVLGLGGLMIAPMLSFMGTGLNATVVTEDKTDELYACDAGVQDAIWQINNVGEFGLALDGVNDLIPLSDGGDWYYYSSTEEPFINDMEVHVGIRLLYPLDGMGVYQVHSWVGSGIFANADTRVDAVITTVWLDYGDITQNVVTTPGEFSYSGPSSVTPAEGEPNGPIEYYPGAWPTPEEMIQWYSWLIDKGSTFPDDEIDLNGVDRTLGDTYVDGDFSIVNSSNTEATLYLTGGLYIDGDTLIGSTKKDFIIDLDGPDPINPVPQTIFVESGTVGAQNALELGGKVTLAGTGTIVAIGDINFEPNLATTSSEYILVLSVSGETWMHPNGDFYGTLAGLAEVYLQNGDINWGDGPPPDFNFPGGGGEMLWGVHTWLYNTTYEIP